TRSMKKEKITDKKQEPGGRRLCFLLVPLRRFFFPSPSPHLPRTKLKTLRASALRSGSHTLSLPGSGWASIQAPEAAPSKATGQRTKKRAQAADTAAKAPLPA